jgi:hypothetical protein
MKRYTQRLQLATVKGTRNMFYESAVRQAKEVARLQKQIKGLLTDVVTTEDM